MSHRESYQRVTGDLMGTLDFLSKACGVNWKRLWPSLTEGVPLGWVKKTQPVRC